MKLTPFDVATRSLPTPKRMVEVYTLAVERDRERIRDNGKAFKR